MKMVQVSELIEEVLGYITLGSLWQFVNKAPYLLYITNPKDHLFEKIEEVPDYYKEVTPMFFVTVLLEQVIRFYQNKSLWKLNDTITNISHGILLELSKIPLRGVEVLLYVWVYQNYCLINLPWDSPWIWILAWILTDFCFYWIHRMTHQMNILWAIHAVHHTPEEIMFTAPMRNHFLLFSINWFTAIPLALAIPPTMFLVHYQLSIIFQYWIHTEIVDKMPSVIEYIFVTPSHHRVHHGRNRQYIDKNFGAFLIIWDRMFGTYAEEDATNKPIYGITKPIRSFNPLIIQTTHFIDMGKRFYNIEGIWNKLSVIFKGPGWSPGEPWTGDLQKVPHPPPDIERFDPALPQWLTFYLMTHFAIFTSGYFMFALKLQMLSKTTMYATAIFFTYSAFAFGFMMDFSALLMPVEFVRCVMYFITESIIGNEVSKLSKLVIVSMQINRLIFAVSLALWTSKLLNTSLFKYVKKTL